MNQKNDDLWGSEIIDEAWQKLKDPFLGSQELALYEKKLCANKKGPKYSPEFLEGLTLGYLAAVRAEREAAANAVIRARSNSRPWYWAVQDIIEGRKL